MPVSSLRRSCPRSLACAPAAAGLRTRAAAIGSPEFNLAPGRGGRLPCAAMSLERQIVNAPAAPAAIGPYSHAVRAGELLFCSGQIPLDPSTGQLSGDTAAAQARACLENLRAVCDAAGTSLARAVRVTVYLVDLGQWAAVNEVYESFF